MSISRIDYIVFGWKFKTIQEANGEPIDIWDEKYRSMVEGHEDEEYTLRASQMSDDYIVFGKLISCDNNDSEGWDFVELPDVYQPDLLTKVVCEKHKELFGNIPEEKPKLFIFSDFS